MKATRLFHGEDWYKKLKASQKVPKGVTEDHPYIQEFLKSQKSEEPKKKVK